MRKKRFALLLLALAVGAAALGVLLLQTTAAGAATTAFLAPRTLAPIDPALQEAMQSTPAEDLRFILHLHEQVDPTRDPLPAAEIARRAEIITRLQTTAVSSQAALRQHLVRLQTEARVTTVRPLWIINAIAVTGPAETISELAARPDVARITLDDFFTITPTFPALQPMSFTLSQTPAATEWGVERVGAPYAWHGLGISGTGVTVAIFDSGVDWLHPDLFPNYRGNLGNGQVNHSGNWYHAAVPGITVPMDAIGHGTHVAGTAVGQNGIGVAPGASWIAVSLASENGLIYESSIHAGFQWLLAPAADPALAPDVINNSWGNPRGWSTDYLTDVQILQTAGIIPVFSTGNAGPGPDTIGAPASYTNTIAVGASDDIDAFAWFSSRGPSPLTADVKPLLVAPGTAVRSSLPQGAYAAFSGTSMAAPHVTGGIALLLAANPNLSQDQVMQVLQDTAVPITATHPNPSSGWGRLDAYRAVAAQSNSGQIAGTVRRDGLPLPNATLIVTTPAGISLTFTTGNDGRYEAALAPGVYDLSVYAFGTTGARADNLAIIAGSQRLQNFWLAALPGGTVTGLVENGASGAPLPDIVVTVRGTPVTAVTDENGRYQLALPDGSYNLRIDKNGYHSQELTATLTTGQNLQADFSLSPAPTTLLLDGGQWYYGSQIAYFEQALQDIGLGYDKWTLRHVFADRPTITDLVAYDQVIWSDPYRAPGALGINRVITGFLDAGGNLLITGKNVGAIDGTGFGLQYWWQDYLQAQFIGEFPVTATTTVRGSENTAFAGLALQLNNGDSANNQQGPDQARPRPQALSTPVFTYPDGEPAALLATHCRPYNLLYLGFGLEGVASSRQRADLLQHSLEAFQAPPVMTGGRWLTANVDEIIIAGSSRTYDFTIQNLSETLTDTLDLTLSGPDWPAELVTTTLTLGPCTAGRTTVQIAAPAGTPDNTEADFVLTAVSRQNPSLQYTRTIRHKTPGDILLVDGDRFYEHEAGYQAGLAGMGVQYDVWDVGGSTTRAAQGSPSPELLHEYDMLIWFTGNDWFSPVSQADRRMVRDYLNNGGRLFLTSQDLLYYELPSAMQQQLGLLTYQTDVTPTLAYGAEMPLVSPNLARPLSITYGTRRNQGDGLIAGPHSRAWLWHDRGMAAGTMTANETWRTTFLAVPLQMLPPSSHAAVINDGLGWISDLGDSQVTAASRAVLPGNAITYTIDVHNWAGAPPNEVTLTNTLPAGLELVPGSLTGQAVYDPVQRRITWQGTLPGGGHHPIRYRAVPAAGLPAGSRLDNSVTLGYTRHDLQITRTAAVWIDAPDLRLTRLEATAVAGGLQPSALPRYVLTYTLHLYNQGPAAADTATARVALPAAFQPVSGTLQTSAGTAALTGGQITWRGAIAPAQHVTVSLTLRHVSRIDPQWFSAAAVIDDGVSNLLVRDARLYLPPFTRYLPLIAKP